MPLWNSQRFYRNSNHSQKKSGKPEFLKIGDPKQFFLTRKNDFVFVKKHIFLYSLNLFHLMVFFYSPRFSWDQYAEKCNNLYLNIFRTVHGEWPFGFLFSSQYLFLFLSLGGNSTRKTNYNQFCLAPSAAAVFDCN